MKSFEGATRLQFCTVLKLLIANKGQCLCVFLFSVAGLCRL
jgi:hypothetical protein